MREVIESEIGKGIITCVVVVTEPTLSFSL